MSPFVRRGWTCRSRHRRGKRLTHRQPPSTTFRRRRTRRPGPTSSSVASRPAQPGRPIRRWDPAAPSTHPVTGSLRTHLSPLRSRLTGLAHPRCGSPAAGSALPTSAATSQPRWHVTSMPLPLPLPSEVPALAAGSSRASGGHHRAGEEGERRLPAVGAPTGRRLLLLLRQRRRRRRRSHHRHNHHHRQAASSVSSSTRPCRTLSGSSCGGPTARHGGAMNGGQSLSVPVSRHPKLYANKNNSDQKITVNSSPLRPGP